MIDRRKAKWLEEQRKRERNEFLKMWLFVTVAFVLIGLVLLWIDAQH